MNEIDVHLHLLGEDLCEGLMREGSMLEGISVDFELSVLFVTSIGMPSEKELLLSFVREATSSNSLRISLSWVACMSSGCIGLAYSSSMNSLWTCSNSLKLICY